MIDAFVIVYNEQAHGCTYIERAVLLCMQGPSMSSGRAYGAAAVLDNALYMVGGMESMNQSFETSTMKVGRLT